MGLRHCCTTAATSVSAAGRQAGVARSVGGTVCVVEKCGCGGRAAAFSFSSCHPRNHSPLPPTCVPLKAPARPLLRPLVVLVVLARRRRRCRLLLSGRRRLSAAAGARHLVGAAGKLCRAGRQREQEAGGQGEAAGQGDCRSATLYCTLSLQTTNETAAVLTASPLDLRRHQLCRRQVDLLAGGRKGEKGDRCWRSGVQGLLEPPDSHPLCGPPLQPCPGGQPPSQTPSHPPTPHTHTHLPRGVALAVIRLDVANHCSSSSRAAGRGTGVGAGRRG